MKSKGLKSNILSTSGIPSLENCTLEIEDLKFTEIMETTQVNGTVE